MFVKYCNSFGFFLSFEVSTKFLQFKFSNILYFFYKQINSLFLIYRTNSSVRWLQYGSWNKFKRWNIWRLWGSAETKRNNFYYDHFKPSNSKQSGKVTLRFNFGLICFVIWVIRMFKAILTWWSLINLNMPLGYWD